MTTVTTDMRLPKTLGDLCRAYITAHDRATGALAGKTNPCAPNSTEWMGAYGELSYAHNMLTLAFRALPGKWTAIERSSGLPWRFGDEAAGQKGYVDADAVIVVGGW